MEDTVSKIGQFLGKTTQCEFPFQFRGVGAPHIDGEIREYFITVDRISRANDFVEYIRDFLYTARYQIRVRLRVGGGPAGVVSAE